MSDAGGGRMERAMPGRRFAAVGAAGVLFLAGCGWASSARAQATDARTEAARVEAELRAAARTVARAPELLGLLMVSQLTAARDGPVVYGHHHLLVTSVDEHKRFWVDTLGGELVTVGGRLEIVKFPDVLVFLREGEPTGGTKGTSVNHIGFSVPSTRETIDRVRAAGYPVVTREELPSALAVEDGLAYIADQDTYIAYTMAPDDVKVEFVQSADEPPMALHHIHFAGPVDEMQAWYVETFGAERGMRGSFRAADLPGVNLTFSPSAETPAGTRGTVLDHIGFEVDGLEAFCRELEARGVVFDRPYAEISALRLGVAFFTDPFGIYIELTEGLDGY